MGQTKCEKCGSLLKVRDDAAGKAVKCPRCGERTVVAFEPSRPAVIELEGAGPPPLPQAAAPKMSKPVETIEIAYGTVIDPRQTDGHLVGDLMMQGGRIQITCTGAQRRWKRAFGPTGLMVMLIEKARSARAARNEMPIVVNPSDGQALVDPPRGIFALELPGGEWVSLQVTGPRENSPARFLQTLQGTYGDRLGVAQMGRMSDRRKREFLIFGLFMLGMFLFSVILILLVHSHGGR